MDLEQHLQATPEVSLEDFVNRVQAGVVSAANESIHTAEKSSKAEADMEKFLWNPFMSGSVLQPYLELLYRAIDGYIPPEITAKQEAIIRVSKIVEEHKPASVIIDALCKEAGITSADLITMTTPDKNMPLFFYFMCPVMISDSPTMVVIYEHAVDTKSPELQTINMHTNNTRLMTKSEVIVHLPRLIVNYFKAILSELSSKEYPRNIILMKLPSPFETARITLSTYLEQKENGNEIRGS